MADHQDNADLSFLPNPGKGHFWEVKYSTKFRTRPLLLSLKESFRPGSPIGETIGYDFAEANEKSLKGTAELILVHCADRKKFVGTTGVSGK